MRLEGKTAIVTGGANGIGRACAERFFKEGANVVIADIDATAGPATATAIDPAGGRVIFQRCDVGSGAEVRTLVDACVGAFGGLHILVNNAGTARAADFLDYTEADFDAVLRVNLKGAFLMGQAAARAMVAGGGGAIINMSSVNSVVAIPNHLAYNVSKGGLNQLTRVMALALADKGVRVNGIGPGSILTDLLKQVMVDDAARRMLLSRTPLRRCGEPEEIASIALFLASDDASYITGQCIFADGGRLALNYTVPVAD